MPDGVLHDVVIGVDAPVDPHHLVQPDEHHRQVLVRQVAAQPAFDLLQEPVHLILLELPVGRPVHIEDRGARPPTTERASHRLRARLRARLRRLDDVPKASRDVKEFHLVEAVLCSLQQSDLSLAHSQQQEVVNTGDDAQQRTDHETVTHGRHLRHFDRHTEDPVPSGAHEDRKTVAHVLPGKGVPVQFPRWRE